MTFKLAFCLLLVAAVYSVPYYEKHYPNYDPEAVCLDGSPSALYVHQGSQKNKFLIFMLGGGSCGSDTLSNTVQSCYQRSKGYLGSSKLWPARTELFEGYLSTDPSKNQFAEWTKVFFIYCDGAFHQGYTKEPLSYKNTHLYFRGSKIVKGHFEWLNKIYGFYNADEVVLTGGSAGGIASFIWTNYLQTKIVKNINYQTIIDSGIFLSSLNGVKLKLTGGIQNIFSLSNKDQLTPFSECNQQYPNFQSKCLYFEFGYSLLKGQIMVLESQYDSYVIEYMLFLKCLQKAKAGGFSLQACNQTEINLIELYRKKANELMNKFIAQSPQRSIWSIGCSNHVYASSSQFFDNPKQKIPQISGFTVRNAIQKFTFAKERVLRMDENAWPANAQCAY